MGRRALRKIDPSLDLTGYYYEPAELPDPFDAEALFGRRGPLEIEVGSGKGLFLETASAEHPERDFLGLEISRKYARFAAARLARAGRRNAAVACLDAKWAFQSWLPEGSAAAVHIYFPDPWWKKRHHKRRIMTDQFLANVERVLAPGGLLHFWTDVASYYRQSLETLARATRLEGPQPEPERPAEHDRDYRTHFERRMRLHNVPVRRAAFRKPDDAT